MLAAAHPHSQAPALAVPLPPPPPLLLLPPLVPLLLLLLLLLLLHRLLTALSVRVWASCSSEAVVRSFAAAVPETSVATALATTAVTKRINDSHLTQRQPLLRYCYQIESLARPLRVQS
jgi:hypothetical protein